MLYTPAQIKETLEITEETLRHWRKALPPLKGKRGYSPCFSPGDLLALKVVTRLHGMGISIRQLRNHADKLFGACSQVAWFGLENKMLVYDGQELEVVTADGERHWAQEVRITVPFGPLIRQLRQRLSEEEPHSAQSEIAFPPLDVAKARLP